MKKIVKRIYNSFQNYIDNRKYSSLSVSQKEVNRLKREIGEKKTAIFGVRIEITNFFWYLHGLNEIFLDQTYKFETKSNTPLILDCGGNIGLSAIYFKQQYPQAQVIVFEADPNIAKTLQSNLNAFGFHDVEVVAKAVWTKETSLSFKSDGSVGGQIVEEASGNDTIEAIRLKDYLDKKIDFLKIDVEGAEYNILQDCKEELANVENIFIEYHSFLKDEQRLDELLLILKQAGFKYYIKEAWDNQPNPYVDARKSHFDLQLNIFGYRI